ncbi:receptor-like kinase TMK4 [Rutidosis leptorrhynchoides]|uniref:receptor-like kinase TMK4 n=1 Tax=Rutidosis leptorrhynchoides TaxID=125765 RepID=UPI003A99DE98
MAYQHATHHHHLLPLTTVILLLLTTTTIADDAAVMSSFKASLTNPPSTWISSDFCSWDGINCDNSNRVTAINLASRSLTGKLPGTLNQLTQLKSLQLQKNSLSGDLPSLSNLTFLDNVFLDFNNFTSIPPNFFLGLINLQTFTISENQQLAPWSIPNDLTESTNLQQFIASGANINGVIPDIFGSFPSLQSLRLSYNDLTGSLPKSFGGSQIQNLWLNNQQNSGLSGNIDVLSSMTELSQVWLQANAFNGSLPDLSKCVNLFDLQLRDNQFTGIVPKSLMQLPDLQNITLRNNMLQGEFPVFGNKVNNVDVSLNSFCLPAPGPCDHQVSALLDIAGAIGYPISLAQSWKGNDACNGWSFVGCDSKKNVISVSLAKHEFSGTISPAFANLTSLTSITLSDNNLVGSIPDLLTSLPNLKKIDVSNNNLSGILPKFPNGVTFISDGNPLLDKVTPGGTNEPPGSGPSSSGSDGNKPSSSKKSSFPIGTIIGIVLGILVLVVILFFVVYKYCAKKKHQKLARDENPEIGKELMKTSAPGSTSNGYGGGFSELQSQSSGDHSEMHVFEGGNVVISIQVLRQVTNNFSEDNILGKGGFGVVYKGELHDGTKIAVKRMESGVMGTKGLKEFQAEIAVLTKVRHRHLVALLGYCINGNERLLVYEYMPQGTLSQHLFEWRDRNTSFLSWKQRVSIALDVARGVEYLHSLAQSSFIHRDLKPSNILLGDMRAKVADFGLVKNAPDGKYSVETKLAGTFGYLAPEYAATGRVTTKVDVYAFGVVLMELITGRKALDETMPEERSHLVTWFRRVLISKENMLKAIDQTLETEDEETLDSIIKVAELAGHCTTREPFQRPDMGHAVNVLGPLVEQWKPSGPEEDDGFGIDLQMSLPQALQRWQADEGTSRTFDLSFTHSSIPSKPSGFADSFDSMDCR